MRVWVYRRSFTQSFLCFKWFYLITESAHFQSKDKASHIMQRLRLCYGNMLNCTISLCGTFFSFGGKERLQVKSSIKKNRKLNTIALCLKTSLILLTLALKSDFYNIFLIYFYILYIIYAISNQINLTNNYTIIKLKG